MSASTEACRYRWETYANQGVSEINQMSHEEYKEAVDQLSFECILKGVSWEETKSIIEYPGGMTKKELELRDALHRDFDPLSSGVLQSHFTHFYQKGRIITNPVDDSKKGQLNYRRNANRLIVDELGKSLQSKGIQPQIEERAVSFIATQEDELECCICRENSLSEPRRTLKCGHEFHARCINSWIALKSDCPLCRGKIPYSPRQIAIAFSILTGLVGSTYIMINHLDSPMRGLFKTTCFTLSYFCAGTAAE